MASSVMQKRQDDPDVKKAFDELASFESEMRVKTDQLSAAEGMTPEQVAEHIRPKEAETAHLTCCCLECPWPGPVNREQSQSSDSTQRPRSCRKYTE